MASYSATIYPKNKELQKYVKYFWAMIGEEPNDTPSLLPPVTDFDIVFSFEAGVDWRIDQQRYSLNETFTCGVRNKPVYIQAKGIINYLSATFYPSRIYPFLGISMSDLRGEPVEIALLPCPHLHNVTEIISNVKEFELKAAMVEKILLKRLAKIKELKNPLLDYSINLIKQSSGRILVSDILNKTGTDRRNLERHFSKWIGISPKQFIKIERFNHVFTNIADNRFDQDWFDLVLRYGYHDQSHLIHDFKSMMEQTPEEFLYNLKFNPDMFAC
jgi:AraC-like DNA-binding protein